MLSFHLRPLLAESLPTDVIRESGFADWIVYLLVFLIVADRLKSWFITPKRDISGSMTVHEGKEYADKYEMETRLNEIENDIESLQRSNTKEHNESRKAGEDRVHAITQRITDELTRRDSKLDELRAAITSKIDNFMVLAARHDAQLPQIEHRVDQIAEAINEAIPRIHQRIDDAMRASAQRTKS